MDTKSKEGFAVTAEIAINASPDEVWEALTNPAMIKKYLMGTEAISDWRVGSPIIYRGIWEGKPYEDKGKIIEMIPGRLLKTKYWSAFSGRADKPENYLTVTYEISLVNGETCLSVTTANNPTREGAEHATANWQSVLEDLKNLLENDD
jgi:uncharacterized protein YndB with AHSA1/START domain